MTPPSPSTNTATGAGPTGGPTPPPTILSPAFLSNMTTAERRNLLQQLQVVDQASQAAESTAPPSLRNNPTANQATNHAASFPAILPPPGLPGPRPTGTDNLVALQRRLQESTAEANAAAQQAARFARTAESALPTVLLKIVLQIDDTTAVIEDMPSPSSLLALGNTMLKATQVEPNKGHVAYIKCIPLQAKRSTSSKSNQNNSKTLINYVAFTTPSAERGFGTSGYNYPMGDLDSLETKLQQLISDPTTLPGAPQFVPQSTLVIPASDAHTTRANFFVSGFPAHILRAGRNGTGPTSRFYNQAMLSAVVRATHCQLPDPTRGGEHATLSTDNPRLASSLVSLRVVTDSTSAKRTPGRPQPSNSFVMLCVSTNPAWSDGAKVLTTVCTSLAKSRRMIPFAGGFRVSLVAIPEEHARKEAIFRQIRQANHATIPPPSATKHVTLQNTSSVVPRPVVLEAVSEDFPGRFLIFVHIHDGGTTYKCILTRQEDLTLGAPQVIALINSTAERYQATIAHTPDQAPPTFSRGRHSGTVARSLERAKYYAIVNGVGGIRFIGILRGHWFEDGIVDLVNRVSHAIHNEVPSVEAGLDFLRIYYPTITNLDDVATININAPSVSSNLCNPSAQLVRLCGTYAYDPDFLNFRPKEVICVPAEVQAAFYNTACQFGSTDLTPETIVNTIATHQWDVTAALNRLCSEEPTLRHSPQSAFTFGPTTLSIAQLSPVPAPVARAEPTANALPAAMDLDPYSDSDSLPSSDPDDDLMKSVHIHSAEDPDTAQPTTDAAQKRKHESTSADPSPSPLAFQLPTVPTDTNDESLAELLTDLGADLTLDPDLQYRLHLNAPTTANSPPTLSAYILPSSTDAFFALHPSLHSAAPAVPAPAWFSSPQVEQIPNTARYSYCPLLHCPLHDGGLASVRDACHHANSIHAHDYELVSPRDLLASDFSRCPGCQSLVACSDDDAFQAHVDHCQPLRSMKTIDLTAHALHRCVAGCPFISRRDLLERHSTTCTFVNPAPQPGPDLTDDQRTVLAATDTSNPACTTQMAAFIQTHPSAPLSTLMLEMARIIGQAREGSEAARP